MKHRASRQQLSQRQPQAHAYGPKPMRVQPEKPRRTGPSLGTITSLQAVDGRSETVGGVDALMRWASKKAGAGRGDKERGREGHV